MQKIAGSRSPLLSQKHPVDEGEKLLCDIAPHDLSLFGRDSVDGVVNIFRFPFSTLQCISQCGQQFFLFIGKRNFWGLLLYGEFDILRGKMFQPVANLFYPFLQFSSS